MHKKDLQVMINPSLSLAEIGDNLDKEDYLTLPEEIEYMNEDNANLHYDGKNNNKI